MLTSEQQEKKPKQRKIRYSEYYGLESTFDDLYAKSKENKIFDHLMDIIEGEENIKLAYRTIKSNSGSNTPGVDKRTIADLAKLSEEEYVRLVRKQFRNYHPRPVRRVEIPKPNGKMRPLGIPPILDRLVQQCILQVMEPICEAKFSENSNGFRPNRSAETAIAQCMRLIQIQHMYHVVDLDIKGFFDNINHAKLMDEFHLLLKEEQTAAYSVEIWKRFRKWGGIPTAITQNVKDLLASREVENIFENSDFVLMLNQAQGDRAILAGQLGISPQQMKYVTHTEAGEGLIFYGNVVLPFVDRFPKDTELYRVMTTKPEEVGEA